MNYLVKAGLYHQKGPSLEIPAASIDDANAAIQAFQGPRFQDRVDTIGVIRVEDGSHTPIVVMFRLNGTWWDSLSAAFEARHYQRTPTDKEPQA